MGGDVDSQLLATLAAAIEKRDPILIVYMGGSQPGTERLVVPLRLSATQLAARELESGITKTFTLNLVRLSGPESSLPMYDASASQAVDRQMDASLVDFISPHRARLEAIGWHVEATDDSLSVHRRFKTGAPQKTPRAGILRRSDNETGRPWYVFGPGLVSARTFADFSRACQLFLDQALGHPPK